MVQKKRNYHSVVTVVLTLALYLSGLFVLLTPLPLMYHLVSGKEQFLKRLVVPAFAFLLFLYFFALEPLNTFYQHHPRWAWVMPVPGMNLLEFLSPQSVKLFGFYYFFFFVGIAVVCHRALSHHLRVLSLIGMATGLFFVFALVSYAGYAVIQGVSPIGFLQQYFHLAITEFVQMQEQAGLPLDKLAFLNENIDTFARYSLLFFPSVLFCAITFVTVLNLGLGKKLFAPFVPFLRDLKLNRWSIDFVWVWVLIGSIGVLLFNSYFIKQTAIFTLAANLLVVLLFVYFLQGLAIITVFLDKKNVGPFFRIMIYSFILILFQSIGFIIIGLGLFDSWFDFRKLSEGKTKKGNES